MRLLFVVLLFFSLNLNAQVGQKAILLDQLWTNFDNNTSFSFSIVDSYMRSLPDNDPVRLYLKDPKNFKAAQSFVKKDFITHIETRFTRKEIIFLNKVYTSPAFTKFNEVFIEHSAPRNINSKLKVHFDAVVLKD